MSQYVITLCCCYEYRVPLLFSQTPAYSAHLNADTANLFRLTFQSFEYQYFSWFVDQPLKLKHTKTVLYTKFNLETFDSIIIRMFVSSHAFTILFYNSNKSLNLSSNTKQKNCIKTIKKDRKKIYLQKLNHAFSMSCLHPDLRYTLVLFDTTLNFQY